MPHLCVPQAVHQPQDGVQLPLQVLEQLSQPLRARRVGQGLPLGPALVGGDPVRPLQQRPQRWWCGAGAGGDGTVAGLLAAEGSAAWRGRVALTSLRALRCSSSPVCPVASTCARAHARTHAHCASLCLSIYLSRPLPPGGAGPIVSRVLRTSPLAPHCHLAACRRPSRPAAHLLHHAAAHGALHRCPTHPIPTTQHPPAPPRRRTWRTPWCRCLAGCP